MAFIPKKYFYDKTVLLLASILVFLVLVTVASVILRLASGQGTADYFVEYRSSAGISAFKTGDIVALISFIIFVVVTFVISMVLSIRAYLIKRAVSYTILSFGILLTLLAAIVSNALLALR